LALANDWRRYEIDLTGVSLDNITHPFGFELSKGNGPQKQVIYIKGLVFDDEPVEEEYALAAIGETVINTPPPLAVEIVSNGTQGEAPATFEFEANITGGTEPYTIDWNFDDGSEQRNDETVVHTFGEADTYNVTLTATDSDDQTSSDSAEIEVEVGAEIDEDNEDIQEQEAVGEQRLEPSEEDQTDSTQNNARAANRTRE
jgi:PKD repeat protein